MQLQGQRCHGRACGSRRGDQLAAPKQVLFTLRATPSRPVQQGAAHEVARGPLRTVVQASPSVEVLPWQAAASEVKKRRDIKKVMVLGAGPIVIGQVREAARTLGGRDHDVGAS